MADYTPKKGDRIRVRGHKGFFIVLKVHRKKRLVDLQPTGKAPFPTQGVPFDAIRPVYEGEDINQAAFRVVQESTKERS